MSTMSNLQGYRFGRGYGSIFHGTNMTAEWGPTILEPAKVESTYEGVLRSMQNQGLLGIFANEYARMIRSYPLKSIIQLEDVIMGYVVGVWEKCYETDKSGLQFVSSFWDNPKWVENIEEDVIKLGISLKDVPSMTDCLLVLDRGLDLPHMFKIVKLSIERCDETRLAFTDALSVEVGSLSGFNEHTGTAGWIDRATKSELIGEIPWDVLTHWVLEHYKGISTPNLTEYDTYQHLHSVWKHVQIFPKKGFRVNQSVRFRPGSENDWKKAKKRAEIDIPPPIEVNYVD